jgi:NAD(P)-dependent dehydrogenase (short-subunit alcohol dehydrogenase family)
MHEMPMLGRWLCYGQSKLANMLWTWEMAKRYPGILAFSVTPGVVATGLVYVQSIRRMRRLEGKTHNWLWAVGTQREGFKSRLARFRGERRRRVETLGWGEGGGQIVEVEVD